MRTTIALAIIMVFLIGILFVTINIEKVNASTRDFNLFGSASTGWGFTAGSITSPGPTISVDQGDVVNLTLTSQDHAPHRFFVDYNNNSVRDSDEPESPTFTLLTINFPFTADRNGTFTYRCEFHPSMMYGTFTVAPAIPEFPSILIIPLFMITTLLAAIAHKRKHPHVVSKHVLPTN
jgi:FtsP/CotA-like multicopper oxidase with cupredoxin domain